MAIKTGENGRIIRVSSLFDMSGNSEISLVFRKPDGTKITKTRTGGQVTLGAVQVVDPDQGTLSANQYVEYVLEVGLIDQVGEWSIELIYENSGANEKFYGETVNFDVIRNVDD
jgi:hypothetical protein